MRRKGKAPPPSRNGVCGRIHGFGKAVRTVPGNAAAHGVSDTARMALSGTMDAPPCIWALLPPRGFPKPYPEASPRALCRSPARRPPCPSEALPAHGPCRRQRGVPPRCQKRRRAPGRPRRASGPAGKTLASLGRRAPQGPLREPPPRARYGGGNVPFSGNSYAVSCSKLFTLSMFLYGAARKPAFPSRIPEASAGARCPVPVHAFPKCPSATHNRYLLMDTYLCGQRVFSLVFSFRRGYQEIIIQY